MPKFARIFTVKGNHQVLLTHRLDDDMPLIVQETYYNEMYFSIKLGFDTEEESEEQFKNYNQEDAAKFFQKAVDILDDQPDYTQQEGDPDLN